MIPINMNNENVASRFLANKTNRCTKFQFFWYYYSTCFGQPFCPSAGVLSLHQLWYTSCSLTVATRSRMELDVSSSILLLAATVTTAKSVTKPIYTAMNSWWWTEKLPETCRVVIPIKLEFSASIGFIHKESATMHGHTILKLHLDFK
jgi:hypothetical protein